MKICKNKEAFLSSCDGTYMMQLEVKNGVVSMKKDIKFDGSKHLLRLYSGDEIIRKIILPRSDPYAAISGATGYLIVKDREDVKMISMFASGKYWICLDFDDDDGNDDKRGRKIVDEDVFERHLCSRCDVIHNAVHKMLCEITGKDLEWDMSYIGDLSDRIVDALSETDLSVCYPSYINDNGDEYRCVDCNECPCGCEDCSLVDRNTSDSNAQPDNDNPEVHSDPNGDQDEEIPEDVCEDVQKKVPAYMYNVKISHPVRGELASFSFNLLDDVREFCNEFKRIMGDDKDAPGCVVYQYDQKTDSYAQILLCEEE